MKPKGEVFITLILFVYLIGATFNKIIVNVLITYFAYNYKG
ncbi:hypothetical protein SCA05_05840 [Staphylococcus carnosus]|nr:hypothetical protein SCA05_05840 [Staphylococcus carnosus]SUM05150.1 Uncharacterised protein [Staphylococcus carnosus]